MRSDSDELPGRVVRGWDLTFAERCRILAMRTRAGDEWSETVHDWWTWAREAEGAVATVADRVALGELVAALGERMQRAGREGWVRLETE